MNKKKNARIRFYSWLAAAAILTLILVLGIFGLGTSFGKGYSSCNGFAVGYSYPNASKYKAGNFTLEEEISQLEINWIGGEVTVKITEGSQVYAEETEVSDDDKKMRYLVENGKLTIQYQKAKFFSFGNWSKSKNLTVYIPWNMAKNMNQINIETVSADIEISDFESNGIGIETVSGQAEIKNLITKTLDIEGVSGDIKGSGIQADILNIELVSGSAHMEGVFEKADLEAVSGDLSLGCDSFIQEVDIETVSGDITLYIPEDNGFSAELDSVSGDLNTEFSVSGKGDTKVYGNGSAEFDFETVSGDVWIKKR